ncbi:MAG TPA: thioesterase family protein [Steroidobacteraceae bacterium]
MAGVPIYQSAILPEWIDYNGHLRDAYYALIVSQASDALMDRLGVDAAYRQRTACTLYTVEMHIHYLHEVKVADTALVTVRILAADRKRIHAAFEILRAGQTYAAAAVEVMLLHVRQQQQAPTTTPFPPEVSVAIAQLQAATAGVHSSVPGSRRMELRGTTRAP